MLPTNYAHTCPAHPVRLANCRRPSHTSNNTQRLDCSRGTTEKIAGDKASSVRHSLPHPNLLEKAAPPHKYTRRAPPWIIISGAVPSGKALSPWQENNTAIETAGPFHFDSKSGIGGVSSEGEASCSIPQKEDSSHCLGTADGYVLGS